MSADTTHPRHIIELTAALDRTTLPTGASTEVKCHVRLRATSDVTPAIAGGTVATSLCVLFDCSSSMMGPRLSIALDAANAIVDTLHERHRLSVVGFQSDVLRLIDNAQATAAHKAALKHELLRLRPFAGGSTNLAAGIAEGVRTLCARPADARVMVILSDGRPDSASRAEQAAQAASEAGIQLFAVGIGADYEADQLLKLVTASNGAVFGDSDLDTVKATLAGVVGRIDNFVATNAHVVVTLGDGVQPRGVYKTSPERAFLGDIAPSAPRAVHLHVGNIEHGQSYAFVLVATAPARPKGAFEFARATLTCDVGALGLRGHTEETTLSVSYDDRGSVRWSADVATAYRGARIAELAQAVVEAQRRGDKKASVERLERLLAHADDITDARQKAQVQELLDRVRAGQSIANERLNALVVGSTAKAPYEDARLFDVVLHAPGEQIVRVVRDVRDVTGMSLREIADLVKLAPATLGPPLLESAAQVLRHKLEAAGAQVEVRRHEA